MDHTLKVSPLQPIGEAGPLALGCWAFGGRDWGPQEERDSVAAMEAAWDCGVRHFDTALAYGGGASERLCGEFLRHRRESAYLATKGMPGLHPHTITDSLETSLRNLGTDHLDLYYLHWPRRGLDLRPYMEALESARERGLIRAIGVSNLGPAEMDQVREVGTINAHQLCYNLLWRRAERDVIPYCARHGIAMLSYSSLAQGILAGRFGHEPVFAPGDVRSTTVLFEPDVWPVVHRAVTELERVAAAAGRPVQHLAVQWIREQRHITTIIVGSRNAPQATDNVAALAGTLSPEVLRQITEISDRVQQGLPEAGNIFRYDP
jgi:myo-inositol catabolism protein IolS